MLEFRKKLIEKRAEKKGWTAEKTKAVLEKTQKRIDNRQTVFGKIASVASAGAVAAIPGAGLVGAAIHSVVPNLPVLKEFTSEAANVINADQKAGLNPWHIVLRDIVPVLREIQEGDWKGAAEGLGAAVAAGVAIASAVGLL